MEETRFLIKAQAKKRDRQKERSLRSRALSWQAVKHPLSEPPHIGG